MDKSIKQVAILFADVSGSTRLYERHGDKMARTDIARCVKLMIDTARDYGGETLKTIGDEVMCGFENGVKAAMAAAALQEAMQDASEDGQFETGRLQIKIGWHFGAVEFSGDELIGEAPEYAQEIIKKAKAGEILTSSSSLKRLPKELKVNARFIDKILAPNTGAPIEVFSVPWEEGEDVTSFSDQPAQAKAPEASLVLEHAGRTYRVDTRRTEIRVGRARECELRIEGKLISRRHAVISYRHGRFQLRDESVNGTVIVDSDGREVRLRREEGVLAGNGVIGFGGRPDEEPDTAVRYRCE